MPEHTPAPWWDESGVAHAKAPNWTEEVHACVHPIANQNGEEGDCAHACLCVNSHDALVKKLEQVVLWLERGAANAFKLAENCQFPKLAAAWTADGKNYRAMAADIRKTLALAEQEKTGG